MRAAPPLPTPRREGAAPPGSAGASAETIAEPGAVGASQNGAVFIVTENGLRGRCSGTAVEAGNRSLVLTAGHCVHDFGHWLQGRWVFVPGYRYGQRPLGTFAARWLGTTSQWLHHENENFDVGMAVVSRNERGQRLADVVEPDKIAWGLSRRQTFDVYGYPVEKPFDGATLKRCPQTPYEGHDFLSFLTTGPLDLAVECDLTPGSSGGGWVIHGDTLNGVTSSGYSDNPSTTYGPYFGSAVARLYGEAGRVK
jgi:V8-like Glu-specific endopeptidase